MPKFGPVKRRELIKFLKRAGFDGPFSGGKHQIHGKGRPSCQDSKPA